MVVDPSGSTKPEEHVAPLQICVIVLVWLSPTQLAGGSITCGRDRVEGARPMTNDRGSWRGPLCMVEEKAAQGEWRHSQLGRGKQV